MNIVGVSCFFHDSAVALVQNGKLTVAIQEERFSRKKQDPRFPHQALSYVRSMVNDKIDYVVFYEKPYVKLDRVLTWILLTAPHSYWVFRDVIFSWIKEKFWIKNLLSEQTGVPLDHVLCIPHHLSHAASAFLCSPFKEAAILTVDGVGEWSTATIAQGKRTGKGAAEIKVIKELQFPNSVGLLYSTFTAFLGFEVNEGEYKVMGMAAYGKPRYKSQIYNMFTLNSDGSIILDLSFFSFHYHRTRSYSNKFLNVFGTPRNPGEEYVVGSTEAQHYADIAASIQEVTQEILLKIIFHVKTLVPSENLCLAGGVALNGVANYRIQTADIFKHMFVQPAAGDAGGAIGAALYIANRLEQTPDTFVLEHAYLGKEYSDQEIETFLIKRNIPFRKIKSEKELIKFTVAALVKEKVIGWYQDRFEWGPRALGNRSIIADPRNEKIKDIVNQKIKFRELFRPFAPSVLAEFADKIFDIPAKYLREQPLDYMLFVVPVRKEKRKIVPAITHVDGTARPQFVHKKTNPLYYSLINEFYKRTKVPLILNTSFNLKGEAIVSSPEDAYLTFSKSSLDYLIMGTYIISR